MIDFQILISGIRIPMEALKFIDIWNKNTYGGFKNWLISGIRIPTEALKIDWFPNIDIWNKNTYGLISKYNHVKDTTSISRYHICKYCNARFDLQPYPWNPNLIKMRRKPSFFWLEKCLNPIISPLHPINKKCASRLHSETENEKKHGYLINQTNLLKVSLFSIFFWRAMK